MRHLTGGRGGGWPGGSWAPLTPMAAVVSHSSATTCHQLAGSSRRRPRTSLALREGLVVGGVGVTHRPCSRLCSRSPRFTLRIGLGLYRLGRQVVRGERHAYGPGQLQSLSHPRIGRHNMLLRKRGVFLLLFVNRASPGLARAYVIVDAVPATNRFPIGWRGCSPPPCQDADEFPAGSPRESRSGGKAELLRSQKYRDIRGKQRKLPHRRPDAKSLVCWDRSFDLDGRDGENRDDSGARWTCETPRTVEPIGPNRE